MAQARAKKYPRWVDEAIHAAACDGMKRSMILYHLREGTLEGAKHPVAMPERTFFDHLARLKKDRGEFENHIEPGTEAEFAGAILRRGLQVANSEVTELQKQQKRKGPGKLTGVDLTRLNSAMKIAATYRASEARRKAASPAAPPTEPPKGSAMERLRAEWEGDDRLDQSASTNGEA